MARAELGSHAEQQRASDIGEEVDTNDNDAAVSDDNYAGIGEDANTDTPITASKGKLNKRSANALKKQRQIAWAKSMKADHINLTTDGGDGDDLGPRKWSELPIDVKKAFIKETKIPIARAL